MALNEDKIKKMQDEMSRFEEEIGLPIPEVAVTGAGPRIIGANTYNEAQKTLAGIPGPLPPADVNLPLGGIPPPPPPPPMPFIPSQVRALPPMESPRGPMDGRMPFGGGMFRGPLPPPPPLPPGPMPPHLGPGPMPPGPMPPPPMPQGPMPPGFNMMGPGPMGPGPMGPGSMGNGPMGHGSMGPGPMGPGPMGPGPMGPGPMGPGPMPPQMMQMQPNFPGPAPPGFQPMNQQRFAPPTSQPVDVKPPPPATTVLSATPMMYVANPQLEINAMQSEPSAIHHMHVGQNDIQSHPEESKKSQNQNKKKTSQPATETIFMPTQVGNPPKKKEKKNKKLIRTAGGQTWEDHTLAEWEDDDFRLFCGDLGNDVTDEVLTRAFSKYPSFMKARVVRDKRTNKTKGFGFVSFKDPQDFIRATKEMNGRYVGSRPIKLRKSSWKARSLEVVRKKDKEKAALISMLTGR